MEFDLLFNLSDKERPTTTEATTTTTETTTTSAADAEHECALPRQRHASDV